MRSALVLAATAVLLAAVESPALAQGSGPPERRTVVLGLRTPAGLLAAASRISNPTSSQYRRFLSLRQYRDRFGASAADVRRVRRYLAAQRGVRRIELSPDRSNMLLVVTPAAGRRLFCASGPAPPSGRLCTPRPLRRVVRLVSAGELFQVVRGRASVQPPRSAGTGDCAGAGGGGTFTPGQLSTAYGVDALHSRGLDGSGIRVVTLSAQEVPTAGFAIWARCFGLRTPAVRQIAMPGATRDTGTAPEETVLDVEALAALAPGLERITPIYVPLDQNFPHSFVVFMLGALDPGRQGGELPDVLSLSDGVCENRFTRAQLRLGRRLLAQAAALGISTLAASGDLGFLGCETPKPGANFPASSAFATSVGGTDLSLGPGNAIASQVVWSTFATDSTQGVGSGGGPSATWPRPRYQQAPGIDSELQTRSPHAARAGRGLVGVVRARHIRLRRGWRRLGDRRRDEHRHAAHGRDARARPPAGARGGAAGARLAPRPPLPARARAGLSLDLLRRNRGDELAAAQHAGRPDPGRRRCAARL